jgi:DNA polymerase delta subunit 1
MIVFGAKDVETTMKMGREAAKFVSSKFLRPIQLEFEKIYYPYLLISKKKYAGLLWTKPEKYDKLDAKGIEVRKRLFPN